MDHKKITEFWEWFSNNENNLNPDKISNDLINELNNKILCLGDFNWEIREGKNKDNLLIISSGGSIGLLESAKKIISLSPELVEWEFCHFKPAKDWNYQLSIEDKGVKRMVNVSDWEYVLLKFSDGTYDILIKADNLKTIPEKDQLTTVNIVLESILGENLHLSLITNVELVNEFTEEYISQKNSIKLLKDHIYELEQISQV